MHGVCGGREGERERKAPLLCIPPLTLPAHPLTPVRALERRAHECRRAHTLEGVVHAAKARLSGHLNDERCRGLATMRGVTGVEADDGIAAQLTREGELQGAGVGWEGEK